MNQPQPTPAEITAAYRAEYAARKPYWIGGVPFDSDKRGIRQHVARKLFIPVAAVAEALRDEGVTS